MSKKKSPRNLRQMPIFSAGQRHIVVVDKETASEIGSYFNAVARLLNTNDPNALQEFVGKSVTDTGGNRYLLETRPNFLYGLTAAEPDIMDQIYRLLG